MGVSENRDPNIVPLNSRILTIRTPNKAPPIFGNPRIAVVFKDCKPYSVREHAY